MKNCNKFEHNEKGQYWNVRDSMSNYIIGKIACDPYSGKLMFMSRNERLWMARSLKQIVRFMERLEKHGV